MPAWLYPVGERGESGVVSKARVPPKVAPNLKYGLIIPVVRLVCLQHLHLHGFTDYKNSEDSVLIDAGESTRAPRGCTVPLSHFAEHVSSSPRLSLSKRAVAYLGYDSKRCAPPAWVCDRNRPPKVLIPCHVVRHDAGTGQTCFRVTMTTTTTLIVDNHPGHMSSWGVGFVVKPMQRRQQQGCKSLCSSDIAAWRVPQTVKTAEAVLTCPLYSYHGNHGVNMNTVKDGINNTEPNPLFLPSMKAPTPASFLQSC